MLKKSSMLEKEEPHVVIIGAGFGGLAVAKGLKNAKVRITMVDRSNHHLFQPLLYQVATAALAAPDIATPTRKLLWNQKNATVWMATVTRIRASKKEIVLDGLPIKYDYLVLAVGSVSNDFAIPGVNEHCLMLDTKSQAATFQQKLLEALIKANTQSAPLHEGQLDVAIVGAGATGVELAAQLHQVTRKIAQYGFEVIDPERHIRLHILDAGPRILPALPERLTDQIQQELEHLGIQVHVSERVTQVTAEAVHTASGLVIPAAIKVWAAGIKGPDFLARLGLESNRINQIKVNPDLTSGDDDRIYAIGDCAACVMNEQGDLVPPRAQAAHQQASFVAKALAKRVRNTPFNAHYIYKDYGSLVTLGRYSTVGSLMGAITGSVRVSGWIARWVYLSLYKMHQLTLFGWWRTALTTMARMLRRSIDPAIKLH